MKKVIAVIGDGKIEKDGLKYKLAFETGKALVDAGYRVQSGGLGGIMEAVFQGAKSSEKYQDGDTIAIIPSFDRTEANHYADIIIPTGIDVMRNGMVVSADGVIAIGGGSGTLSEMALAWSLFRLVIAYCNVDGWSSELAGRKLDSRERYQSIDDKIYGAETPQQAIEILDKYVDVYTRYHHGIKYRG